LDFEEKNHRNGCLRLRSSIGEIRIGRFRETGVVVDAVEVKKRSKVKEIIVLIKARSFLDELNLEHLTS